MSSPPPRTPREALRSFLLASFRPDEFRRFLRDSGYPELLHELPERASPIETFEATLEALDFRGRLDRQFFEHLTTARDNKRDEITALAAAWQREAPPELLASGSLSTPNHERPDELAPHPASEESEEVVLVSWMHVADLQIGGEAGDPRGRQSLLEELCADAQALVTREIVPHPDFLFLTGDIAFTADAGRVSGRSEYATASEWISKLQDILEVSDQRVFMVPGNHDVGRQVDVDVRRLLRLVRAGDERLDDILQSPRELPRLRGRAASYLAFTRRYGPPAAERFHDGLWWRRHVALGEGVSLRICGLNTALLSLDDQDQGQLYLGASQYSDLFAPQPQPHELLLVLGHHPLTGRWLADGKDFTRLLDRHSALYLHGHRHEPDSRSVPGGWASGWLPIAAGASFPEGASEDSPRCDHGYNFGALVVLATGDLALRIWPRRRSTSTQRFIADAESTPPHSEYAERRLGSKYRIPRTAPQQQLRPGVVLGDRYRLLNMVGQGGVGQVWRAADLTSADTVAVKLLRPDRARSDPAFRKRFYEGAAAMASLRHPAIVRVRDPRPEAAEQSALHDYYVMDLIDAPPLSEAFAGAPRSDAETITILLAIAEAVAVAHAHGVLHRDLKPSNILRDPRTGEIFIIDFDTAKQFNNLTDTRSGQGLVTMLYASPEMFHVMTAARGDQPVAAPFVDVRTDVFSLALVGYFLRTGRNPPARYINLVANLDCAAGLRDVLKKACEFASEDRFADMHAFTAALRELASPRATVIVNQRRPDPPRVPPPSTARTSSNNAAHAPPETPPLPPATSAGHLADADPVPLLMARKPSSKRTRLGLKTVSPRHEQTPPPITAPPPTLNARTSPKVADKPTRRWIPLVAFTTIAVSLALIVSQTWTPPSVQKQDQPADSERDVPVEDKGSATKAPPEEEKQSETPPITQPSPPVTSETGEGKDSPTVTTTPASGTGAANDGTKQPANPAKQDSKKKPLKTPPGPPKPPPGGTHPAAPTKQNPETKSGAEKEHTMLEVAEGFQKVINQYCYPSATVRDTTATFRFTIDTTNGAIKGINIVDKTGGLFELCAKSVDKLKQQLSFASVNPRYLLMSSYQLDYKFTSK